MIERWLLFILYAAMAVANVIRGVMAFVVGRTLTELSLPLPALGVAYLLWAIGFLYSGLIFLKRPGRLGRQFVRGIALLYQTMNWTVYFLGVRSSYARSLWRRDLILTLVFLLVVFALTAVMAGRRRLGRDDDPGGRESE